MPSKRIANIIEHMTYEIYLYIQVRACVCVCVRVRGCARGCGGGHGAGWQYMQQGQLRPLPPLLTRTPSTPPLHARHHITPKRSAACLSATSCCLR
jgi:hypothetical protein